MQWLKVFWEKGLTALFLIALSNCSSHSTSNWKQDSLNDLHRSIYQNKNVQLEILSTETTTTVYLNTLSLKFPSTQQQPGKTTVIIQIDDQPIKVLAHRFQGGQKLLFDEPTRKLILSAIKNQQVLALQAGRYHLKIDTDYDSKLFSLNS